MQMQRAARKKAKIKMAISAPTGFGKTYSALLLAYGITGDWTKICVIDSENASADLYSDLGEYNVITMKPPYNVGSFVSAMDIAIAGGMEVVIVDSTYHYWHGKGGLLEYNNSLGGRYQDWAKTNPLYAQWLDKILQSPVHVICTSRKKQAYEMTKDSNGKTTVEKKGLEDEIRSGFDYEMMLAFNIINDKHMVEASKDRTRLFMNQQEFVITEQTGRIIKEWCDSGVSAAETKPEPKTVEKKPATEKDIKAIEARMRKEGSDLVDIRTKALSLFTFDDTQAEYLVSVEKEVSAERNKSNQQ